MYTIGQVSRICRVSVKTMRHYERLGLICPAWTNPENGYRHYTPEQVQTMRNILFLRDLGLPLRVIQQVIAGGMAAAPGLKAIIAEHRAKLLKALDQVNGQLVRLSWWETNLEVRDMNQQQIDISVQRIPEIPVFSQRRRVGMGPQHVAPFVRETLEKLISSGAEPAGAPIMVWHDEEFVGADTDLEVAWPVTSGVATGHLPEVKAAIVVHVGPYDGITQVYEAIYAWINANGYKQAGPAREISCNDPAKTPPEKLVTQVVVPIA